LGRRHCDCLGIVKELERLAAFALTEFVEVDLRGFEDFARAFALRAIGLRLRYDNS